MEHPSFIEIMDQNKELKRKFNLLIRQCCGTCDVYDDLEHMNVDITYIGEYSSNYGRNMCGWCMVEVETFFENNSISEGVGDFNLVQFRSSGFNAEVFMTKEATKKLIYFMTLHRLPNPLNDSISYITRTPKIDKE